MKFGKVKSRTFNYQPRFSEKNGENVSDDKTSEKKDFISKWEENRKQSIKVKGALSLPVSIALLVLLLIGLYVLNSYIK